MDLSFFAHASELPSEKKFHAQVSAHPKKEKEKKKKRRSDTLYQLNVLCSTANANLTTYPCFFKVGVLRSTDLTVKATEMEEEEYDIFKFSGSGCVKAGRLFKPGSLGTKRKAKAIEISESSSSSSCSDGDDDGSENKSQLSTRKR